MMQTQDVDLAAELRAAADALDAVRREPGRGLGDIGRRLRARADALARAPAGAGWDWLAEQGDGGAALAGEFERWRTTRTWAALALIVCSSVFPSNDNGRS